MGLILECSKSIQIPTTELHMGLTHAIYVSDMDAIYGIRGGAVWKFNPNTGAPDDTGAAADHQLFAVPGFEDTYLVYEPSTAKLYVYNWCQADGNSLKGVYTIDPTFVIAPTFNSFTSFVAAGGWSHAGGFGDIYGSGGRYAANYSSHVFWFGDGGYMDASGVNRILSWQPPVVAQAANLDTGTYGHFMQLAIQPVTASTCRVWFCEYAPGSGIKEIWYSLYDLVTRTFGALGHYGLPYEGNFGVDYCASNSRLYVSGLNNKLVKMNPGTGAFSEIDIGYPTSTKYRVHCSTATGKSGIYIPVTSQNVVVFVNTATDEVTVKTGFDMPFDIVSTPTRVFAVQFGMPSLKEIT